MKITLFLILFSSFSLAKDYCVKDVKWQFDNIPREGQDIPIKVDPTIFVKRSYTHRLLNNLGIDNHFQGIQKLPMGNSFVITGSDIERKQADLIIINQGFMNKKIVLDKWPYWHPGGIQLLGNILAVPVEEYRHSEISKIYFYEFNQDNIPTKLPVLIDIPKTKSGAVMFHRMPDGKYLVGSYNMTKVDLYISNSSFFLDGFKKDPILSFDRRKFDLGGGRHFEFGAQGVNIIPQCDGKLFMIFFENTGKLAPVFSKDDRTLLFQLDLNSQTKPVSLVSARSFTCHKQCNFAAATGIHIEDGKLIIYSSPHYLSLGQNSYNIREFKIK